MCECPGKWTGWGEFFLIWWHRLHLWRTLPPMGLACLELHFLTYLHSNMDNFFVNNQMWIKAFLRSKWRGIFVFWKYFAMCVQGLDRTPRTAVFNTCASISFFREVVAWCARKEEKYCTFNLYLLNIAPYPTKFECHIGVLLDLFFPFFLTCYCDSLRFFLISHMAAPFFCFVLLSCLCHAGVSVLTAFNFQGAVLFIERVSPQVHHASSSGGYSGKTTQRNMLQQLKSWGRENKKSFEVA